MEFHLPDLQRGASTVAKYPTMGCSWLGCSKSILNLLPESVSCFEQAVERSLANASDFQWIASFVQLFVGGRLQNGACCFLPLKVAVYGPDSG